jgi:hypothetical protein
MRTFVSSFFMFVVMMVGLAGPAQATTSTVATGTFKDSNGPTITLGHFNGATLARTNYSVTWTGYIAGTCAGVYLSINYADGSATLTGSETCTGTVAGKQGSFSNTYVGGASADGSFWGQVVVRGEGPLASFHAEGPFWDSGVNGVYGLRVHGDC